MQLHHLPAAVGHDGALVQKENGSAGPGEREAARSQPQLLQVETVLSCGGKSLLSHPSLPARSLVPIPTRPAGFGSVCTSRGRGAGPCASACLLPETKKPQPARLFKRSCNMLLLWVIAGFFYTDITIIILSSRKN